MDAREGGETCRVVPLRDPWRECCRQTLGPLPFRSGEDRRRDRDAHNIRPSVGAGPEARPLKTRPPRKAIVCKLVSNVIISVVVVRRLASPRSAQTR